MVAQVTAFSVSPKRCTAAACAKLSSKEDGRKLSSEEDGEKLCPEEGSMKLSRWLVDSVEFIEEDGMTSGCMSIWSPMPS